MATQTEREPVRPQEEDDHGAEPGDEGEAVTKDGGLVRLELPGPEPEKPS